MERVTKTCIKDFKKFTVGEVVGETVFIFLFF